MAIYRTLVTKTDEDGRLLCELFMRRPSPKVYPEYYLVIKEPIDFREILHRIRTAQVGHNGAGVSQKMFCSSVLNKFDVASLVPQYLTNLTLPLLLLSI